MHSLFDGYRMKQFASDRKHIVYLLLYCSVILVTAQNVANGAIPDTYNNNVMPTSYVVDANDFEHPDPLSRNGGENGHYIVTTVKKTIVQDANTDHHTPMVNAEKTEDGNSHYVVKTTTVETTNLKDANTEHHIPMIAAEKTEDENSHYVVTKTTTTTVEKTILQDANTVHHIPVVAAEKTKDENSHYVVTTTTTVEKTILQDANNEHHIPMIAAEKTEDENSHYIVTKTTEKRILDDAETKHHIPKVTAEKAEDENSHYVVTTTVEKTISEDAEAEHHVPKVSELQMRTEDVHPHYVVTTTTDEEKKILEDIQEDPVRSMHEQMASPNERGGARSSNQDFEDQAHKVFTNKINYYGDETGIRRVVPITGTPDHNYKIPNFGNSPDEFTKGYIVLKEKGKEYVIEDETHAPPEGYVKKRVITQNFNIDVDGTPYKESTSTRESMSSNLERSRLNHLRSRYLHGGNYHPYYHPIDYHHGSLGYIPEVPSYFPGSYIFPVMEPIHYSEEIIPYPAGSSYFNHGRRLGHDGRPSHFSGRTRINHGVSRNDSRAIVSNSRGLGYNNGGSNSNHRGTIANRGGTMANLGRTIVNLGRTVDTMANRGRTFSNRRGPSHFSGRTTNNHGLYHNDPRKTISNSRSSSYNQGRINPSRG